MLKLYLFNAPEGWYLNETHASGVIAESQDEAVQIYQKRCSRNSDYEITEFPIKRGLIVAAAGHDFVDISARL